MSDRTVGAGAPDAFERQVAALAGRMRDDGIEPTRDLWPGVAAALDAAGMPGAAAASSAPSAGRRTGWPASWPGAALAAVILLAIGIGLTDRGRAPGGAAGRPAGGAADGQPSAASAAGEPAVAPGPTALEGLRAVGLALDDVQAALNRSPDDADLTRLVLLIHHARGRLLRLQAGEGVREARRSPA